MEQELRDREQQQDAAAIETSREKNTQEGPLLWCEWVLLCLKLMLRLPRAGAVLCLMLLLCLRETPKKGWPLLRCE